MPNYMTEPLSDLKEKLLIDGIITKDDVRKMRERLFDNDMITRDEAEFMFAISDAVLGKRNHAGFGRLFIDVITHHVLITSLTPGRLDDQEWRWLQDKMLTDCNIEAVEALLLHNIAEKAETVPQDFTKYVHEIEPIIKRAQSNAFFNMIRDLLEKKTRWEAPIED